MKAEKVSSCCALAFFFVHVCFFFLDVFQSRHHLESSCFLWISPENKQTIQLSSFVDVFTSLFNFIHVFFICRAELRQLLQLIKGATCNVLLDITNQIDWITLVTDPWKNEIIVEETASRSHFPWTVLLFTSFLYSRMFSTLMVISTLASPSLSSKSFSSVCTGRTSSCRSLHKSDQTNCKTCCKGCSEALRGCTFLMQLLCSGFSSNKYFKIMTIYFKLYT